MSAGSSTAFRSAAARIAIYTHDTYGLGHVRRCVRIATALARRAPAASILLVTGSPALGALERLPPNADVLKIPTVVKTGPRADRPPHLGLAVDELTALRTRITASALDEFRPDVLLVDNFPLGSRRELAPVLAEHTARGLPAVLGLRDVVDHPDVVRRTWTKEGLYDVLERQYARVLVYGRREILDVGEAYAFPDSVRDRVTYCGYVTDEGAGGEPAAPADAPAEAPHVETGTALARRFGVPAPVLVAAAGGGGDGLPLLAAVARALPLTAGVGGVLVTGPLMSPRARGELDALTCGRHGVRVTRHVADLPDVMDASDVLVTMGGYNTLAELARRGRRAIVVPRDWRYGEQRRRAGVTPEWEQRLRAEALERVGLVRVLMPDRLTPRSLAHAIDAELEAPRHLPPPWPTGEGHGADRVAGELLAMAARETTDARR